MVAGLGAVSEVRESSGDIWAGVASHQGISNDSSVYSNLNVEILPGNTRPPSNDKRPDDLAAVRRMVNAPVQLRILALPFIKPELGGRRPSWKPNRDELAVPPSMQ